MWDVCKNGTIDVLPLSMFRWPHHWRKLLGKILWTIQNHLENKETNFWLKGFEILQNINDRLTLEKELKCYKGPNFSDSMRSLDVTKRYSKHNKGQAKTNINSATPILDMSSVIWLNQNIKLYQELLCQKERCVH